MEHHVYQVFVGIGWYEVFITVASTAMAVALPAAIVWWVWRRKRG
ncbi:hypothetical protein [Intestinibacillus massiliensis]|nr:hypothetical protein [Intestinibacillus massiliensis]